MKITKKAMRIDRLMRNIVSVGRYNIVVVACGGQTRHSLVAEDFTLGLDNV